MTLKMVPCVASGLSKVKSEDFHSTSQCTLCDHTTSRVAHEEASSERQNASQSQLKLLWKALSQLSEHTALKSAKTLRILLAQAIYRLVNHCGDADNLDLSASTVGRW